MGFTRVENWMRDQGRVKVNMHFITFFAFLYDASPNYEEAQIFYII
jgi:hypothetical protein